MGLNMQVQKEINKMQREMRLHPDYDFWNRWGGIPCYPLELRPRVHWGEASRGDSNPKAAGQVTNRCVDKV